MIVTFISQCQKKAINRTRQVLDAFANRIGDFTWQTVITEEGLAMVKKLLSQTASKNTAVSCYRFHTRKHSELLWIVGNRNRFNEWGWVAVNYTEQDISDFYDNYQWRDKNVMSAAVAMAGLFHDIGKANILFQNKLNPALKTAPFEPYRHEWVSLRLFEALTQSCQTDNEWLDKLINAQFDDFCHLIKDNDDTKSSPLRRLSHLPFAQLVAWLIVAHHRLPLYPTWKYANPPAYDSRDKWLTHYFHALWNSPNCYDDEQKPRVDDNWRFADNALPNHSAIWRAMVCNYADLAKKQLATGSFDGLTEDIFTSHLSRLALMLADRYFSSLSFAKSQEIGRRSNTYHIYANTYYLDNGQRAYKQQLDEHLIGVAKTAVQIVNALPKFRPSLAGLDNDHLQAKVDKKLPQFQWQNAAQKTAQDIAKHTAEHGFFGINMASTGCGKTIANAKIMYALGQQTGKVRFSVALGLRTLTLQTGQEFQRLLGLDDNDLSIVVGGVSVKSLFHINQNANHAGQSQGQIDNQAQPSGSESIDETLNPEIFVHYTGKSEPHALYQWTKNEPKADKLLQAPVLVCTIDHLIAATEGTRGGHQIVPILRLLSSDLVLDEPDDFDIADLPALCRLVHWAGMLGSRVLLSTATMPPMLAYACFEAYRVGWAAFAKANLPSWDGKIQCAWFDEWHKPCQDLLADIKVFQKQHDSFVDKRIAQLSNLAPRRLGKIVHIEHNQGCNLYQSVANRIFDSIIELDRRHRHNNTLSNTPSNTPSNQQADKTLSFGLVRMANINPMIAVAKALIAKDAPDDTQIHYCVYHGRYPLLMRSHIEKQLDSILKRKQPDAIWQNAIIRQHICHSPAKHHIFVVIASPVAEVGRDHDYDWAVVEPSSVRSIVQLAGRILRHRDIIPDGSNVHLLNQNIKALKGEKVCFTKPGFEQDGLASALASHDLQQILQQADYQAISAIPKIRPIQNFKAILDNLDKPLDDLSIYEQVALRHRLFSRHDGAAIWWSNPWVHWAAEIPFRQPFRRQDSSTDETCYLWIEAAWSNVEFKWCEPKDSTNMAQFKPTSSVGLRFNQMTQPTLGMGSGFWFDLSPVAIYQQLQDELAEQGESLSLAQISQRFGSFVISQKHTTQDFEFYEQFGIFEPVRPKD
ncbi:type I-F CRISPR-associated helicase Cas3f [Moraxella marmotae]|uniref:type I-F CRISPR-associated helicase Cas3f n=1 Tax=Moraxella marmotae TaxID=3344520 RepID=UPI0035F4C1FA